MSNEELKRPVYFCEFAELCDDCGRSGKWEVFERLEDGHRDAGVRCPMHTGMTAEGWKKVEQ